MKSNLTTDVRYLCLFSSFIVSCVQRVFRLLAVVSFFAAGALLASTSVSLSILPTTPILSAEDTITNTDTTYPVLEGDDTDTHMQTQFPFQSEDPFFPSFHLRPPQHWVNDPNGVD
jgi:hypothetical protein